MYGPKREDGPNIKAPTLYARPFCLQAALYGTQPHKLEILQDLRRHGRVGGGTTRGQQR